MQTIKGEYRVAYEALRCTDLLGLEDIIKTKLSKDLAEFINLGCEDREWIEMVANNIKHSATYSEYTDLSTMSKVFIATYNFYSREDVFDEENFR